MNQTSIALLQIPTRLLTCRFIAANVSAESIWSVSPTSPNLVLKTNVGNILRMRPECSWRDMAIITSAHARSKLSAGLGNLVAGKGLIYRLSTRSSTMLDAGPLLFGSRYRPAEPACQGMPWQADHGIKKTFREPASVEVPGTWEEHCVYASFGLSLIIHIWCRSGWCLRAISL